MSDAKMLIPMSEEFCVDLIRWGGLTPNRIGELAEEQLFDLLERNDAAFLERFLGTNAPEFASKYLPDHFKELTREMFEFLDESRRPLVWKEVSIDHGTRVRMQYGGETHFATVLDGKVEDESGRYSPSEWASKIATGTSRNAWRDLWFKEGRAWVPAQMLREQALAEIRSNTEPKA